MKRATIRSGRFLYVRVEVADEDVRLSCGSDGAFRMESGHKLTLGEARRVRDALSAAIATIETRQAGRGA